jgi:hypothetical protein
MTNKIEKLNAEIKKESCFDHLVLNNNLNAREIDMIKIICDKIDEILDEVNSMRMIKNDNIEYHARLTRDYLIRVDNYAETLEKRIAKLEEKQTPLSEELLEENLIKAYMEQTGLTADKYILNIERTPTGQKISVTSKENWEPKENKLAGEKYPMGKEQLAQIDCKRTDCKYYDKNGNCNNTSPAISLSQDGRQRCLSLLEDQNVDEKK